MASDESEAPEEGDQLSRAVASGWDESAGARNLRFAIAAYVFPFDLSLWTRIHEWAGSVMYIHDEEGLTESTGWEWRMVPGRNGVRDGGREPSMPRHEGWVWAGVRWRLGLYRPYTEAIDRVHTV